MAIEDDLFEVPQTTMALLGTTFLGLWCFNLYYHQQFINAEVEATPQVIGEDNDSVYTEAERYRQEAWINSLATEKVNAKFGYDIMLAADAVWTVGVMAIMTFLICMSQ